MKTIDISQSHLRLDRGVMRLFLPLGLFQKTILHYCLLLGMVQFIDLITGKEKKIYTTVTCQICVRAEGKHNDLEQIY